MGMYNGVDYVELSSMGIRHFKDDNLVLFLASASRTLPPKGGLVYGKRNYCDGYAGKM